MSQENVELVRRVYALLDQGDQAVWDLAPPEVVFDFSRRLIDPVLRRMPAEEVGDHNMRFAVVIPTGAEVAALRVPRRVRDVLRIDVYAVSDDGQVERLTD
jgi:hypothetical protein